MERLKYWFGGRQSQRSSATCTEKDSKNEELEDTVLAMNPDKLKTVHLEEKSSQNVMEWIDSRLRKVVPLKEGDCLSCKVLGTSATMGGAILLLVNANQKRKTFQGREKFLQVMANCSFACALALIGTCRWFDIGFFERKEDEQMKTAEDYHFIQKQINYLKSKANRIKPGTFAIEENDSKRLSEINENIDNNNKINIDKEEN